MEDSNAYLYDTRPSEDRYFVRLMDAMIEAFLQGNNGTAMALLANLLDLYPEKVNRIGEELLGYQIRLRMTAHIVNDLSEEDEQQAHEAETENVFSVARKIVEERQTK